MLETLRRIVQTVSAASDLDEAARIIVRRVKEAMGVDLCSVYLTDEDAGQYVLMATEGLAPEAVGRVRLAQGEGLVGFVGEEMDVAEIAAVPADCLAGILCTRGSALPHTAILARGLDVPAVMGLGELSLSPLDGLEVVVDAYQGRVYIQPSASVRDEYFRLASEEAALTKELEGLRGLPAQTPDGTASPCTSTPGCRPISPQRSTPGPRG